MIRNILSKPYIYYNQNIFPRVKNIRGSYRANIWLRKLSWLGLDKIGGEDPEPISQRDFDNLILLDACRHDFYEKLYGDTQYRITVGSSSKEFIQRNFSDSEFKDVVYITANPHFHESQFKEATGRSAEEVFHTVFHVYQDGWNEEEKTVMPQKMVDKAVTAEKLFPEKRKIIHFMQPHLPFVNYDFADFNMRSAVVSGQKGEKTWDLAMKGKISQDELKEAYQDNLEFVKPYADEIAAKLDGKTVISADHGTFLGENGLYKHPPNCPATVLRKVPWDVV